MGLMFLVFVIAVCFLLICGLAFNPRKSTHLRSKSALPLKEEAHLRNAHDSSNQDLGLIDIPNNVEITYTIFGYDEIGGTTFDMEINDRDYEWLAKESEGIGSLDSDYISENRQSLHKKIIRAIHNNINEETLEPDDGMVEVYVSGVHRTEYHEEASYDHASYSIDDDDIEYSVDFS